MQEKELAKGRKRKATAVHAVEQEYLAEKRRTPGYAKDMKKIAAKKGLAEELKPYFKVAWNDPSNEANGYKYLYLSEEDANRFGIENPDHANACISFVERGLDMATTSRICVDSAYHGANCNICDYISYLNRQPR